MIVENCAELELSIFKKKKRKKECVPAYKVEWLCRAAVSVTAAQKNLFLRDSLITLSEITILARGKSKHFKIHSQWAAHLYVSIFIQTTVSAFVI